MKGNEMTELTEQDKEMLRGLRKAGCAVCVFLPHEMPHSDPSDVEDAMCEGGWRQINFDTPDGKPISA
jgi:hypothetical protein